jgi:gamma-glutamyltranspeptidase/glutathione hydrolase
MVSSPHYLASMAGTQALMMGGNAMDAAIAANAVLTVVYPHNCSPGGDLFMLVYSAERGELIGLNASGRSPRSASIEALRARGYNEPNMPKHGIGSVNVPGTIDGWSLALERFGKLDLGTALAPAIRYAQRGFPVTDKLSNAIEKYRVGNGKGNTEWAKVFLKDFEGEGTGRAPRPGEIWANPDLARSYRTIAKEGKAAFYSESGSLARDISDYAGFLGGFLSLSDLKDHKSDWVQPLSVNYRGYRIFELGPNTQGLAALLTYDIMQGFDLSQYAKDSAENIHLGVEAKKRAFLVRDTHITDADYMQVRPEEFLQPEFVKMLRDQIDPERATVPELPDKPGGDTIYLCAVDAQGNAVSLIQSLYDNFGSGVVVPETGILLHNRSSYFSLDPQHANRLEGGKRTMHTLLPAMAFDERQGLDLERGPDLVFGTMGADAQAQIHWQLINGWLDYGLNVQQAIEAPRWRSGRIVETDDPMTLTLEANFPPESAERLRQMGHKIQLIDQWSESMGHSQAIALYRTPKEIVMEGGADPRGDGAAIGW